MIGVGFPQPGRSQAEGLIKSPRALALTGAPSLGLPGRGRDVGTGRQAQPCSPYPSIPISPLSALHVGDGWVSQDSQGICFSCLFGPHCLCAGPWHLQELLSCPLQLLPAPRACCGSRDMSWQEWDKATCPCSWGPLSPLIIPLCLPYKREQHWQLPPLSSDHFPLPLLGSSASFPGLYAAPSIPYTCYEQVYLCTLSIMLEVSIAWTLQDSFRKIQFPLCLQAA